MSQTEQLNSIIHYNSVAEMMCRAVNSQILLIEPTKVYYVLNITTYIDT